MVLIISTVLACGVVALIVLPALPGIALQVAGFERLGDTETVFDGASVQPTAVIVDATRPQQVVINAGQYGTQPLTVDTETVDFVIDGSGTANNARASVTEAGLLELCQQMSPICQSGNDTIRNIAFDFRPGGAVVYADFAIQGLGWQRAGMVMRVNNANRIEVIGMDVAGQLFAVEQSLQARVQDVETQANALLDQLIVQAGGGQYSISQVIIDDTTLTVELH